MKLENYVNELLSDDAGHGILHVKRVYNLSMYFSKQYDGIDLDVIKLAAYLHDVDDYKIFGNKNAEELINARNIMNKLDISLNIQEQVLDIIKNMGYNKFLKGIRPSSIEGKIISDADMCDALGANGILRTYAYSASKGVPFFNKDLIPIKNKKSVYEYKNIKNKHCVQHFFDKLLLLPNIMLTECGKKEAIKRYKLMVYFLEQLFVEENSTIWIDYLNEFLDSRIYL